MKNIQLRVPLAVSLAICLVFSITGCRGTGEYSSESESSLPQYTGSSSISSSYDQSNSSSQNQTTSQDTSSGVVSPPAKNPGTTVTTPSNSETPVTPQTPTNPEPEAPNTDKLVFPDTLTCGQNKGLLYEKDGAYYYLNKDFKICRATSEADNKVIIDEKANVFEVCGEYGYYLSSPDLKIKRFLLSNPEQQNDCNISKNASFFTVATLLNGQTYLFYQDTNAALRQKNADGSGAEKILVSNRCENRIQVVNDKIYFIWKNEATEENSLCWAIPDVELQQPSASVLNQYANDFVIAAGKLYLTDSHSGQSIYRANLETGSKQEPAITSDSNCYNIGVRGNWIYYTVMSGRDTAFKRAPIDGSNPAGTVVG